MLSYLFYAEQHGDISFALQQGSALLYKKDKYRRHDENNAVSYVFDVFLLIMLFIFKLILLPQVEMVYSSFGSNTPLLTEQILSAIKLLPYIILTAILTVIIGGIFIHVVF